MSKFGYLDEESAKEFISKVKKGHELIKEFNNLKENTENNLFRKRQIEIELNDIDEWFNK